MTRTLGLMAEYPGPDEVLAAARALRADGYRRMDAYVPYPVEGLEDALGFRRSWLNWAAGAAGTFGAAFAFWIQWMTNHRLFALNIGGRPSFAIPAFLIVVFETMVLFSGVTAFVLFFWTCRLPRLAHPLFRVPGFESALYGGRKRLVERQVMLSITRCVMFNSSRMRTGESCARFW